MSRASRGTARRARRYERAYARSLGAGLSIDASELAYLADRLAMVPVEQRKAVRPVLQGAGYEVRDLAARNASWSSRIPGSLRVRVTFTGPRPGVYVYADGKRAEHARPFEGMTGRNPFRHPVFGDRERWVAQAARPFLVPALRAKQGDVQRAIQQAVMEAFAKAGVTD